jgi:hypothetical protein
MKKIKSFEEFSSFCSKGVCLRKTMKTHKCSTEAKQKNCFDRYDRKLEKDKDRRHEKKEENKHWVEITKQVKLRDKTCRIWEILTKEERLHILKNFEAEFRWLSKTLDTCHIISRAQSGELKYDLDNLLLISRFFHRRLTDLQHPVTGEPITKDQETEWYLRAKNGK